MKNRLKPDMLMSKSVATTRNVFQVSFLSFRHADLLDGDKQRQQ